MLVPLLCIKLAHFRALPRESDSEERAGTAMLSRGPGLSRVRGWKKIVRLCGSMAMWRLGDGRNVH